MPEHDDNLQFSLGDVKQKVHDAVIVLERLVEELQEAATYLPQILAALKVIEKTI